MTSEQIVKSYYPDAVVVINQHQFGKGFMVKLHHSYSTYFENGKTETEAWVRAKAKIYRQKRDQEL